MSDEPRVALVPLGDAGAAAPGRSSTAAARTRSSTSAANSQVTDAGCPHNGGPLAKGLVRDGVVTCPWHWYSFDLRTGECRTAAGYRLRKYPVISRDGRLFAQLPDEVRPRSWSTCCARTQSRAGRTP